MRINKSLITFTPTSGAGSGTVTSVALSATMPTGLTASISGSPITSSGTLGLTLTFSAGYSIPTTAKQTEWDSAYTNRITSLTTTGSSGAATLASNVLNIPNYTLAGLGGVPTTRTITINGTSFDLSANRTYNVGTVTSVAALTIGTSGTDITSSVANGTTTPVITLNIPTASATNRGALSSTDWLTFSSKQPAITLTTTGSSGSSTLIGATLNVPTYTLVGLGGMANPFSAAIGQIIYSNGAGAPLSLLGNTTTTKKFLSQTGDGTNSDAPFWSTIAIGDVSGAISLTALSATSPLLYNNTTGAFSIQVANVSQNGYLSSSDWTTFNSKQSTITLTTTGNSGASTLVGATLNVPEYTLAGLGGFSNPMTSLGDIIYANASGAALRRAGNTTTTKMFLSQTGDGTSSAAPQWSTVTAADTGSVPTSRTITINGTSFDLSANRTYSVGTVTSVALSVPTGLSVSGSPITTSGTLAISLASGYSIPTTASQTNWDAAYNDKINSAAVTGTTTKTLTLTQQDGGTITASWTDINTDAVTSVFGRTGAVVATSGDYTTAQVTESGNLYYLDSRARASISETITGIDYNNTTGVFSITSGYGIPTTAKQTEWDTAYTNRITSLTTTGSSGAATLISNTLNIPNYTLSGLGGVPTTRTITINDVAFDLSANREWSVGDFGTW